MNMELSKDTCCCHITHWLIDCKNDTNSLSWSLSTLFAKRFFSSFQSVGGEDFPILEYELDLGLVFTNCGRNDGLSEEAFHISAFS